MAEQKSVQYLAKSTLTSAVVPYNEFCLTEFYCPACGRKIELNDDGGIFFYADIPDTSKDNTCKMCNKRFRITRTSHYIETERWL